MATRQYIGARYVIKVYENSQTAGSAEWEANTSYEPLTMVTYQNSSYLSKKAVPSTVGNPASNPTYWAVTGAYNGQIAQLQNNIANINTKLATPDNKKVLFIGDSYLAVKYNNKNIADYVSEYLGIDYTDSHYAGYGFTDINNVGKFITLLQNVTANRESYTDIIVLGGCNDYDSVANTQAAIKQFCEYAYANFPNAIVHVAHLGGFNDSRRATQITNKSLPAYRRASAYGAHYIKNSEYIMYSPSIFDATNAHPVDTFIPLIALYIAEGLMNGFCDIFTKTSQTPTAVSHAKYHAQGIESLTSFINNGRVGFMSNSYRFCSVIIDDASIISGNTFEQKIIEGITFYGFPTSWTTGLYSCPVRVTDGTHYVPGFLYANSDGSLTLSVDGISDASTQLIVKPLGICDIDFDIT